MASKNLILGITTGVAIAAMAAYFLKRNRERISFEENRANSSGRASVNNQSSANHLLNKARHRAQHLVSNIRKDSDM